MPRTRPLARTAGSCALPTSLALLLLGLTPQLVAAATSSPVADAAMRGDVEAVRSALRAGADANAAQGDGMTALHWAAHNGVVELAEMLLYAGANPESGTRIGNYTPLHVASKAGNAEVVAALLEAGGDPNIATTAGGARPLHFAAAAGSAETLRTLLAHGAEVNATEGVWGQTPLMFAVAKNRVEAMDVLLEAGADLALTTQVVDVVEREKQERKARKIRSKQRAAFRKIVEEENQDPEEADSDGEAPEEGAAEEETAEGEEGEEGEVAEEAEETEAEEAGADEDSAPAMADEGDEPSEVAGEDEPLEAEESPDPRDALDEPDEAEELERPKPPTYGELVGGHGGMAALLHACREGHLEAVLALLEAGADIDQVSEGDQTSPLLIATINGHFDLAKLLVERGANPNLASAAGATPLHAALDTRWAPKASYPQQNAYKQQKTTHVALMETLLEAGADPNARLEKHLWYASYNFDHLLDLTGATPFWRASYATDLEAMRLLIAFGADPDIPTRKLPRRRRGPNGEEMEKEKEDLSGVPPVPVGGPAVYPIHAAAGAGYGEKFSAHSHHHVPDAWLKTVQYLVEELGADVNARDDKAYTPLHHAAARGDNEMILYLVSKGAHVDVSSRKGETTADMANGPVQRVRPFFDTIALLEFMGSKNNQKCLSC